MALWTSVDEEAGKPKNLTSAEKLDTYGISVAEATTPSNLAKGINTPGWVNYTTYEDAQENVRHKSEVLVALRSMTNDANDDTVAVDPVITIGTQPQSSSVAVGAATTFSIVATVNNGGVLTYQWQRADSGTPTTFANISGATSAQYTIGAVASGDNGDRFRVIVSSTGAAAVTSSVATLTVA
jgi:hypothetical protein